MAEIRRILVRAPNWIGDHVMALPFYRGLRRLYPDASLTLLGSRQVIGISYEEIFQHSLVLESDRNRHSQFRRYAGEIRERGFDMGINLPASLSSSLLLLLAGVPVRIGFDQGGSGVFLTHAVPWKGKERTHKSALYFRLLRELSPELEYFPTKPSRENRKEPLIVIAPGAALPLREWPYFAELLQQLSTETQGFKLVVVGTDKKWSALIKRLNLPVEDLIGQTDLAGLQEICSRASLVIANDSGVAHLAATLAAAPTLVLFGPGDPAYIRPMGDVTALSAEGLPCRPCNSNTCQSGFGYQACLRELPVSQVLSRVRSKLLDSAAEG